MGEKAPAACRRRASFLTREKRARLVPLLPPCLWPELIALYNIGHLNSIYNLFPYFERM